MKNFNIFGFTEKSDFKGKEKNNIEGGDCQKRGAWQERGWCFEGDGGWYPTAHYIS